MRRKTNEEFCAELKEKQSDKFTLLGEYVNAKTKMLTKCNDCGNIENRIPEQLLKGSCRSCYSKIVSKKVSKTDEEFRKEVEGSGKYILLSQYKSSKTKCAIKHKKCGNIFKMAPDKFSMGQRCPKCRRPNYGRTHEDFLKEFNEASKGEYTVLGTFTITDEKTLVRHNKCGYEYKVSPHKFIRGNRRCSRCSHNMKLTQKEFLKKIDEENSEYEVLSEYQNNHTPVSMRHKKCGHIYNVRPYNFFSGKRCPKCRSSKGEQAVGKYLSENGFEFESQFRIGECKITQPLPFDFAVFKNKSLTLIEFQGEQHYKARPFFGGNEAFQKQKIRDKIKFDFCKKNKIPLIVIPYYNIDKIPYILKDSL